MAKLKPQEKEKIREVQEIEARLRASANSASTLVSSWLGGSNDDSDSERDEKTGKAKKAREVFKGRPARLGVGAKFLSHKEMMASQAGAGVLTAEELRLKRKLTRNLAPSTAGGASTKKEEDGMEQKQAAMDNDDDGDSRSKMVGASAAEHKMKDGGGGGAKQNKKAKRSSAFLDTLVKRRKR
ncbi:hypothetical protein GQ54DRAFT_331695 [Martensiomyces pterosporus]|nr:hypothetical protein GQ54DRAFT_331695 [Martensiomyces pterosporus]